MPDVSDEEDLWESLGVDGRVAFGGMPEICWHKELEGGRKEQRRLQEEYRPEKKELKHALHWDILKMVILYLNAYCLYKLLKSVFVFVMDEYLNKEGWWNNGDRGKSKYSDTLLSKCHFSNKNPTWIELDFNPDLRDETAATNRLRYGVAISDKMCRHTQKNNFYIVKLQFVLG
jgi:hypothetical protein